METKAPGITVTGSIHDGYDEILTPEALQFLEQLERHFGERRRELLAYRKSAMKKSNRASFHIFSKKRPPSENPTGPLPRFLKTCRTGVWRLPGRLTGKW